MADVLYERIGDPTASNPVLVHALSGFLDAGSVRQIAVDHLVTTLPARTIATFDIDSLFDYRARRPRMVFNTDHFESVDLPALVLSEIVDAAGQPFLLLHGPEPDIGWQRVVRDIIGLVDDLSVRLSVGINAIPWASPHTRPVGVTAHASDPELVIGYRPWVGALQIPGHLGALLELELGRTGHQAVGFAVHVPHYLVGADYPRGALTILDHVARAGGLSVPVADLEKAAAEADESLDAQVRDSPENAEAIAMLEAQYDAMGGVTAGPDGGVFGPVPTGEEIASQVEDFLRGLDGSGDKAAD